MDRERNAMLCDARGKAIFGIQQPRIASGRRCGRTAGGCRPAESTHHPQTTQLLDLDPGTEVLQKGNRDKCTCRVSTPSRKSNTAAILLKNVISRSTSSSSEAPQ